MAAAATPDWVHRCDMPRPFVGLNLPIAAGPDVHPADTARAAERLGFDFVSVNDHPEGNAPVHEAWTLLTWAAAHTERIAVATRVIAVQYRNPALLAKMAATLARLAPGRVILGLGGGAGDGEMQAFGMPTPTAREKIDQLAEATQVVRGLWSSPSFTFDGSHYRTDNATIEPRPSPPIPVWFGTFGPRGLRATGELADGWIPSLGYAPDAALPNMRGTVLAAAEAAGRNPGAIRCVLNIVVRSGEAADEPATVHGSPEQITERLQGLLDLGFHGFNIVLPGTAPLDDASMLAAGVLPLLNAPEFG
jgi:alkanesulfonate monooxygenase SsuD/methylene tetrahydromethanopterin reductase-like flavin-dependent oxidoreductase (luciferase family)